MGKTTDKAIDALSKQSKICIGLLQELRSAAQEMVENGAEWDKYEDGFTSNFNRLYFKGITEESEMMKDAEYKKAATPFRKVESDREEIWNRGKALCIKALEEINKLGTLISDLHQWVVKRKKSKNPFKSKASIPAAELAVTNYQQVKNSADAALSKFQSESFR